MRAERLLRGVSIKAREFCHRDDVGFPSFPQPTADARTDDGCLDATPPLPPHLPACLMQASRTWRPLPVNTSVVDVTALRQYSVNLGVVDIMAAVTEKLRSASIYSG